MPWLKACGHSAQTTRFDRGAPPPEAAHYDGLVVLGGAMSVNDEARWPWLKAEKQALRQALERKKPVLGICLGAQMLAQALGANVYPNAVAEIGWLPIQWSNAKQVGAIFGAVSNAETTVFHWHAETFDLPEGAVLLAASEYCRHQAFVWGETVVGLQFHLEISAASVHEWTVSGAEELRHAGGPAVQTPEQMQRKVVFEKDAELYLHGVLKYLFGG